MLLSPPACSAPCVVMGPVSPIAASRSVHSIQASQAGLFGTVKGFVLAWHASTGLRRGVLPSLCRDGPADRPTKTQAIAGLNTPLAVHELGRANPPHTAREMLCSWEIRVFFVEVVWARRCVCMCVRAAYTVMRTAQTDLPCHQWSWYRYDDVAWDRQCQKTGHTHTS